MSKSASAFSSFYSPDGGPLVVVRGPLPYIAVYRVTEHAVEISRIFHGAQDWP
jgi:plasmid stabilization system protein ParE